MKQIIQKGEQAGFLERFYGFGDAVIRSISLRFADDGSRGIDVYVSARDSMTQDNEGWIGVVISVDGVSEMAVRESIKTTIQVLSQGVHIATFENKVGIEFGGAIDPPTSLVELQQSDAFALGEALSFEALPY